jgi:hypothetical protein
VRITSFTLIFTLRPFSKRLTCVLFLHLLIKKIILISRRGSRIKTTSESTSMSIKPELFIDTLNAIENDEIEVEDEAIELKQTLLNMLQKTKDENLKKRKLMKIFATIMACLFILFTFIMGILVVIRSV